MSCLLDLDSLHKIRDIKIKEISSMKKPKKPKFTHTSREFLKVFAFGILFLLFFVIIRRSSDKVTMIFIFIVSLLFMSVGLLVPYIFTIKNSRSIIKRSIIGISIRKALYEKLKLNLTTMPISS